jgi:hypothetical protein
MGEPVGGLSGFFLDQTEGGETRVQVSLFEGTVWLTQRLIAEVYQKSIRTINEHIRNIYEEREVDPQATIRKFRIVQPEGTRQVERLVDFSTLDVILAVDYRVRSRRGTPFRQWATKHQREYGVKGFVRDDERLKEARDFFDELLTWIRDIRASERRFYQKITDISAMSVDSDPKDPMMLEFFKTVQNRMHRAIHGHTAAETISLRADCGEAAHGVVDRKQGPNGWIHRTEVGIAKNPL